MFMLENLAESFSELVFIHYNDIDNLNQMIATVKPDIVLATGIWGAADLLSSPAIAPLAR